MWKFRTGFLGVRTVLFCIVVLGVEIASAGSLLQAADVPWLEQVVCGPERIPMAERGRLAPLLLDADGEPIKTLEQWQQKRRELRAAWYNFLGPMPETRPKIELRILYEDRDSGCVRQLVEYECEPQQWVQGYLLTPLENKLKKLPALVVFHQTTDESIEEIAGLKGSEEQHLGSKLARRGFIVFCPRNYLWQGAENYKEAVEKFKSRHPQTLGMHKMLYDAMRGVDVLERLPLVDAQRIGCVGHSLGGKESLYLAAFDDRIQVTVASEPGIGLDFTNWHAPWYLGQAITEEDFVLDHHQLVAMIAPKPFLLLAGESGSASVSDGDRSWPYLAAAHPVCRLYGQPVRIGMFNHRQGHSIPSESFSKMAEWLETYLSGSSENLAGKLRRD